MLRLALFLAVALSVASCTAEDAPLRSDASANTGAGGGAPVGAAEADPPEADRWEWVETALGGRVYVPIYSHIYFRDSRRDIDLAATLSIRNTDATTPIEVTAVRYYDSAGALVRRYIDAPVPVGPMASEAFVVEQRDDTGGVGANFIVEWRAERAVVPPVIEAVMIGAGSAQGISFVTTGRVLQRARPAAPLPPASAD